MTAFSQSIMQSKSKAIHEIAQKLEKTYEENSKNLVQYWRLQFTPIVGAAFNYEQKSISPFIPSNHLEAGMMPTVI